jgi:hypothetical protein
MSMTQMTSYSTLERETCTVASCSQGNGVQLPALGKFSYSDLFWTNNKNVEIAIIPSERLNDFIAGEEDRCSCTFTTSNVVNYLESPSRNRTVAFKATYNCCYGPNDDREKFSITNPAATQAGKRRKKLEMGEGLKVGCQARFRATIYFANKNVVELRVYEVCKADPQPC